MKNRGCRLETPLHTRVGYSRQFCRCVNTSMRRRAAVSPEFVPYPPSAISSLTDMMATVVVAAAAAFAA